MAALQALPAVVFLLGAVVAFATGSAWGTMSILFPVALPLVSGLSQDENSAYSFLVSATIAAILSGSVWGNHTSPIADSGIMSSTATRCDHPAHIKTQLLYALVVGALALGVGALPVGFGLYHVAVAHVLALAVMASVLLLIGQSPTDKSTQGPLILRLFRKLRQ